jgi:predicted transcriptional regulator
MEGDPMVSLSLRLPDELHEKLRWLAFKERRSQHAVVMELLQKALAKVEVPKEARK